MGEDNLGLSTLAQGAKKNYEFLVKRDTQDNFGQSLITCFIFIAHSIYLQAYNAKKMNVDFLKYNTFLVQHFQVKIYLVIFKMTLKLLMDKNYS